MIDVPVSEQVLRRSGSSFAMAFRLLPPCERAAMTAFYAYCREIDDVVDLADDLSSARRGVEAWSREIDLVHEGKAATPLGREVQAAVETFTVGTGPLRLVLEGVRRDLEVTRYETFDELYGYCYHVASAVGQYICAVLGADSAAVRRYAELTGVAVQLTNVLRDVAEDGARGRIYLPLEDMRKFGVCEQDALCAGRNERLVALLRFEAMRARELYAMAEGILDPHWNRRLYFARALSGIYRDLLDLLEKRTFGLQGGAVKLPAHRKLSVIVRYRLKSLVPSRTVLLERRA
jgi:phytoene synthase